MPHLLIPGVDLHYDTFGAEENPLLVLIPGADGRGSIYHTIAGLLSSEYFVVCYDRRGYSRSNLRGDQDFEHKVLADAHDAHLLIQHLARDRSSSGAIVFGTSSGGIVGLHLLVLHPESVKHLIAHEAPLLDIMPQEVRDAVAGGFAQAYNLYRSKGPAIAVEAFTTVFPDGPERAMMRSCLDCSRSDEIRANTLFWFEFELPVYPIYPANLQAILEQKDKLLLCVGEDSGANDPTVTTPTKIGTAAGKKVHKLPGGHVGYMTIPQEFTAKLLAFMKAQKLSA